MAIVYILIFLALISPTLLALFMNSKHLASVILLNLFSWLFGPLAWAGYTVAFWLACDKK
jgi:hypothetical protein